MVTQSRLFHPPLCFEVCLFVLVPSSNEWHAFPSSFWFSTLARAWQQLALRGKQGKRPKRTNQHHLPLQPTQQLGLEVVRSVLTENSTSQSVRVAHSEVVNRRFAVQHLFPYCSIRENRSETKYRIPLWLPAPNYTGVRISKIDVRAWSWTWWSHHGCWWKWSPRKKFGTNFKVPPVQRVSGLVSR